MIIFPMFNSSPTIKHISQPDYSKQLNERNNIEREKLNLEKEKQEVEKLQKLTDDQLLTLLNRTNKTISVRHSEQVFSGRKMVYEWKSELYDEANPEYKRIEKECFLRGLV